MAEAILIWGTGWHARVVADVVRCAGQYEIVGFIDDFAGERAGQAFCGAPILGGREALNRWTAPRPALIVAVGDNRARLRLAAEAKAAGFGLAKGVHPAATIAEDARIAAGTVVMAGAVVNPGCRIGENVIINTGATVDHGCVVEDGAHVSAGVHLAGLVEVGEAAWIAIGATVIDRVRIGARTMIGAGSVVTKDVPADVVACGVPARVARRLVADD